MGKLVNRTMLTLTLPNDMILWLKKYSQETGIPMSRLIEKWIKLNKDKLSCPNEA
jgi:hypothetical protein